jgi:succinate dehydrogenase / fumarate reductase flavoprotein subunit
MTSEPTADDDQIRSIIRSATDILNRESGENPYLLHEQLEELMQSSVGIVRTEELLTEGITGLDGLKQSFKKVKAAGASQFNPGWHEALALRNLLITSEAVAQAALLRQESRGAHTRVDYPGEQDEWLRYNVVLSKADDGSMKSEKIERPAPDAELDRIAGLSIEAVETEVAAEN